MKQEAPDSLKQEVLKTNANGLPITPPSERLLQLDEKTLIKKQLTTKLKSSRKPRLKYRPANGTVLNITSYDDSISIADQDDYIDNEDVGFLHYAFKHSKKMCVVTGAGISVASGIPDFRSSNGLFQGLKSSTSSGSNGKSLFDHNLYRDSESTGKFHAMINQLHSMISETEPTDFHKLLDSVSNEGRLLRLYTQNIDCLECELPNLQTTVPIKANPPYPPTIQLHGTIKHMYCTKCYYSEELKPELFNSSSPPVCHECLELDEIRKISGKRSQGVGFLRPRIVLYNEFHPDGEHIGKVSTMDLKSKPDCLVIAGTSLKIPGVRILVKELARAVHAAKGCVIWMNKDLPSTSIVDYIEHIDLIVEGDCQDVGKIIDNYQEHLLTKVGKKKRSKQSSDPETKDIKVVKSIKTIKPVKNEKTQTNLEQLVSKISQAN